MLSLSRVYRIALILFLSLGYVASHAVVVYAQDDDEEEEGGDDDGGDDGGDEGGEEEEAASEEDQPPVTAGGLFTMRTYPVRETLRPLTMTQKIAQVRLSLGTDISAKGAFKSVGVSLEGLYGMKDNVTLLGGFTSAYNMKQFGLYFGFEGALLYDMIDIRLAANVHRNAVPGYALFCNPSSSGDNPAGGTCGNAMAEIAAEPDGNFSAGGTKFSLELGFPFRYAIRPEIAIVALQTLMTIDFNEVQNDYVIVEPGAMGAPPTFSGRPNKATPDLVPSVGIATNPVPPLSVTIFAQLRVIDFDTTAGAFQVPVTGRIQFSPNQKFDVGLEFTLLNVKPPEGQSPIENRYLALFAQSRFGK
jgi:hypothetical protein